MPKLSKLQLILLVIQAIASALSFAIMLGLWLADVSSILPYIFLGQLVAMAMTVFLGGDKARSANVQPVAPKQKPRQAVVQVNTRTIKRAGQVTQNSAPSEGFQKWAERQFDKIAAYFKPKASSAFQTASNKAQQGGAVLANKMKQSPALWFGILFALVAGFQALFAFRDQEWELLHMVIANGLAAGLCFLNHFNKMGETMELVKKEWRIVWLVASIGGLFLSIGHGWGAAAIGWSVVSALGAIASMRKWLGPIGNKAEGLSSTGSEKLKGFFRKESGIPIALVLSCLATLVVYVLFYFTGEILDEDEMSSAQALALLYVILGLIAAGVIIWKIHQKMNVKVD